MCMPGISRNLLSVGRLLDEHGGQVAFTKHKAHLVSKGKHVVVAERNGSGLYIVCNRDYELGAKSGTALAGTSVSLEVAKQRVIACIAQNLWPCIHQYAEHDNCEPQLQWSNERSSQTTAPLRGMSPWKSAQGP